MRKLLLIAGVAAFAIPGLASAQTACRQQQHDNRVAGTVVGAGLGALLGSAVAGHGSKGTGAVVGAIGGGAIGNIAGGASTNCDYTANGYYDNNGVWHAATGYYDSTGAWVEGAPPPYAGGYSADVAYTGAPNDVYSREDFIQRRIENGLDRGALSQDDADRDLRRLGNIRDLQGRLREEHDGLTHYDRADLNARLDVLNGNVDAQMR
jgi:hypothetical protein